MKKIIGIGLVALDVILEKNSEAKPLVYAGGSCGNLMCILSYLGFNTYPIARLAKNKATEELINDFKFCGVNTDLIITVDDGSTPIIIQRLSKSKTGLPIHRFEFRDPENGKYLPSFKPVLAKSIDLFYNKISDCDFFYLDRISRSSIELAKFYKSNGAIVILEPSSLKISNQNLLNELIGFVDVLKFSSERIPQFKEFYEKSIFPLEIETLGEEGVNYRIKNSLENASKEWQHIPSFNVGSIVDSAGAGDWTTAGLVKGLIDNQTALTLDISNNEIERIIKYAQSLGSLSCLYKGARGMMYNLDKDSLNKFSNQLLTDCYNELFVAENTLDYNAIFEDSISSLLLH